MKEAVDLLMTAQDVQYHKFCKALSRKILHMESM